jgi:hypothetical protein
MQFISQECEEASYQEYASIYWHQMQLSDTFCCSGSG